MPMPSLCKGALRIRREKGNQIPPIWLHLFALQSLDNTYLVNSDLGGIGSDPIFNSISPLYNADMDSSSYYNTTEGSNEVNPNTGLPYGFFHHPLTGYEDGYPLLISGYLSEIRSQQSLQFISTGDLWNPAFTDHVVMEVGNDDFHLPIILRLIPFSSLKETF